MKALSEILENKPYTKGQIITKPTLLSDCGILVTIDDKQKYNISIEQGDYLIVIAGASAGKASMNFDHPNISATKKVIHEFKHYRKGGSKFWTSRAGKNYYFVIPRDQITLLPEKGYSYIPAEINGVKVTFNVSGGGGGGVWTDFLRNITEISVNHRIKDLKKIAEVAVRNSPFEPIQFEIDPDFDERIWNRLALKSNPKIKETIAKMIEEKKSPIIHLIDGWTVDGNSSAVGIEVKRKSKKIPLPPKQGYEISYRIEYCGALKSVILNGEWRAKMSQIDWYKTAVANNLI